MKNVGEALKKIGARLLYRGPDKQGEYITGNIALGSNRLSIVDVPGGHQPLVREQNGRRYAIVYNGEVYNYKEIRRDLEANGLKTVTNCDTEVVLLAYMLYGGKCVARFDGQFAFAIWDEAEQTLFLARDIAGIKPLFYTKINDAFVFASEPKALFEFPGVLKAPNLRAICEYFLHGYAFASGYVTGESTFFENVYALPPGHTLKVQNGKLIKNQYWHAPYAIDRERDVQAWTGEVREVLERRIGDYVSLEVPVGVALSGGVDSSIITSLAAREMNRYGNRIVASTIVYQGRQVNADYESATRLIAWLRSQGLKVDFVQSTLSPEDYLSELDQMITHFDEPHWEIKQLAMFRNYRRLKECGAKVVLTGEGADELFYGYYQKFPGFKHPRLESSLELQALWRKRLPYIQSLFANSLKEFVTLVLPELMEGAVQRYYEGVGFSESEPEKRMQHWYFCTFLPWLLTVNDRCSMAFALEGRFPFLDKEVIEMAFRMPAEVNADGVGKNILRKAFADILPRHVRDREKAPLPSPVDLGFHEVIQAALELELASTDGSGVWDILSMPKVAELNRQFKWRLADLERSPQPAGGESLTSYMYLSQPVELKTVHVFSVLTLIRWFRLNFESAGDSSRRVVQDVTYQSDYSGGEPREMASIN
ncbi:MAG: asparagine synthase (glutamine-hydrolyzing) [Nitrososphaera sp.]|nr:asparagine synthase (glutamine-hydrolyzing) [Nitrososphaera sp.]